MEKFKIQFIAFGQKEKLRRKIQMTQLLLSGKPMKCAIESQIV